MKITVKIFVAMASVAIMLLTGCKDIIEENISNKKLDVISPSTEYVTAHYTVSFLWNEVKGARSYRLQLVNPSFNSIQNFVLDTSLATLRVAITLTPGEYEWRLRAENGSSNTDYVIGKILVDTNTDFTGQDFNVYAPADYWYTNSIYVGFSWDVYPFATTYEYVLSDTNNISIRSKSVSGLSIADTFAEGVYKWKVRAINDSNNTHTDYSQYRYLFIDITSPATSSLVLPINDDTLTNQVLLSWKHQSADVYRDSIFVASDSLFSSTIFQKSVINAEEYLLPALNTNTVYYWKIRSFDKANNVSPYTTVRKFRLIP